jgi:hypothetical protein
MFQINNMPARVLRLNAMTALIWCLAAAGLVFWILKFPHGFSASPELGRVSPKGRLGFDG